MARDRASLQASMTSLTALFIPSLCNAMNSEGVPIARMMPMMATTTMSSMSVKAGGFAVCGLRFAIEKRKHFLRFGLIGNRQSAIGNFMAQWIEEISRNSGRKMLNSRKPTTTPMTTMSTGSMSCVIRRRPICSSPS